MKNLILLGFLLLNTILFSQDRTEKTLNREQQLVQGLSHANPIIRDSCARAIRALLIRKENVIQKGGIVEHEKNYWQKKLKELPENYSRIDVNEKFELSDKKVGWLNRSAVYHLDHDVALIQILDDDHKAIQRVSIIDQKDFAYVEPDGKSKYLGIWRNYFYNGEIHSERSFQGGKISGFWNLYYPNGMLKQTGFYQMGEIVEKRRFGLNGKLQQKTIYHRVEYLYTIINYDEAGEEISSESRKRNRKRKFK